MAWIGYLAFVAAIALALMWFSVRDDRQRDEFLVKLGLVMSGDDVLPLVRAGWRVYQVSWGGGEYWIVDGDPQLDSKQCIFANGKKLGMGGQEPALVEYPHKIEKFNYRTRSNR